MSTTSSRQQNRVNPEIYSKAAEDASLGSILTAGELPSDVALVLKPRHFYQIGHRAILSAILAAVAKGEPVDVLVVARALEAMGHQDQATNTVELTDLITATPTSINALAYARAVWADYIRRLLVRFCSTVTNLAYDPTKPVGEVLAECATGLQFILREADPETTGTSTPDLVIPTALQALNQIVAGGWRPGQVYVISTPAAQLGNDILTSCVWAATAAGHRLLCVPMKQGAIAASESIWVRTLPRILDDGGIDELKRIVGLLGRSQGVRLVLIDRVLLLNDNPATLLRALRQLAVSAEVAIVVTVVSSRSADIVDRLDHPESFCDYVLGIDQVSTSSDATHEVSLLIGPNGQAQAHPFRWSAAGVMDTDAVRRESLPREGHRL